MSLVDDDKEIETRTLGNAIVADDVLETVEFPVSDATAAWKFKVLPVMTEQARINDREPMPQSFQKNEAAAVNVTRVVHCLLTPYSIPVTF